MTPMFGESFQQLFKRFHTNKGKDRQRKYCISTKQPRWDWLAESLRNKL